jgi:hypothetical protein
VLEKHKPLTGQVVSRISGGIVRIEDHFRGGPWSPGKSRRSDHNLWPGLRMRHDECKNGGRAKLSLRSRWKNGPEVFVFWPNVVIFEARIIAIPSPSLSKMKYVSVREDLSTLCSYAQPFLDPPSNSSLSPCAAFYLPCFCRQKCSYFPNFSSFSRSFSCHHNELAWPDPFLSSAGTLKLPYPMHQAQMLVDFCDCDLCIRSIQL